MNFGAPNLWSGGVLRCAATFLSICQAAKVVSVLRREVCSTKDFAARGTAMPKGTTPITVTHPEVAAQANGWDPSTVTAGSSKKMSWKCDKGHVWDSPVYNRTLGSGCPYCTGRLPILGETDLATTHPRMAKEALFDPTTVRAGSGKRMRWRCADGHEWSAYVYSRTGANAGCPYCAGQRGERGKTDLLTTFPTLAAQAQEDISGLKMGSHKKIRWKCEQGHEWSAAVSSRALNGRGCPMCAGQRVIPGENDLATLFPDIAVEARFDPTLVMWGSNKKMPWRCSVGHEWEARVADRTRDSLGCPYCSGKRVLPGFNDLATTHSELALEALFDPTTVTSGSGKKVPWRCVNGHEWKAVVGSRARNGMGCPVCSGQMIVSGVNDLATLSPELALEALFDATKVAVRSGKKLPWKCSKGHIWDAVVAARSAGVGCPVCSGYAVLAGYNDIATTHPELAEECLDDPTTLGAGSEKFARWRCSLGHEYRQRVNAHMQGRGCPYCAGQQVLVGFNDLATVRPDLAAEAMFDPQTKSAGSGSKMRWKCHLGHEWLAAINSRSRGNGCPSCAESGYNPSKLGWLYLLRHERMLLIQVGITNVPEQRLAFHRKGGWEIMDVRGPMDGALVAAWEASFKRMAKIKGLTRGKALGQGFFSGYTEAWPIHEFEVFTIRELMEAVEKAEDDGLL